VQAAGRTRACGGRGGRGAGGAGRGRRCGADGSTGHGLAGSKWGTGEGQQRTRRAEDGKTWQTVDDDPGVISERA